VQGHMQPSILEMRLSISTAATATSGVEAEAPVPLYHTRAFKFNGVALAFDSLLA